jgi:uncharacterized protein
MPRTLGQHLDASSGPKRILSIDGGGLRGVLSLEFLGAIEAELRRRAGGDAQFRLCDYFDLIGGTSTGSVIAAALACGMSVAEIRILYARLGGDVFTRSILRMGVLAPKFSGQKVLEALQQNLGADTSIGSDRIRTGLMIMTKRLDTGSPWPIHNHPAGPYAAQSRALLLAEVVRASTAAPTYFEPEILQIHSRAGGVVEGAFVDGGVSPFNDPALQLLTLATLQGHGFRWKPGADSVLLISVGTGRYHEEFATQRLLSMVAAEQGLRALQSLMDDCARVNHMILQWLTNCLTPWPIDREIGDMKIDSERGPRIATYARYDVLLNTNWLRDELGLDWTDDQVRDAAAMDDPTHMPVLTDLGVRAAVKQFSPSHLPEEFD